jgi:hypothetical protein
MGLIEERHEYTYQGHRILVLEDGVRKRVTLLLDGVEAASESCMLPQEITLTGAVGDVPVRAKVETRLLRSSVVSVEVGGVVLTRDEAT